MFMGSRKDQIKKEMLTSAAKSNKRVPVWVMMKTNRKVSSNPKQKNWRRSKKGQEINQKIKKSKGE